MSDSEVAYPTADSGCSYKGGCERPPWREGKCLYHSPSNGDSAATARLVWNTAREMAADKDAVECDFEGWHFPKDPDGHYDSASWRFVGWFTGFRFEKPVSFNGATFRGDAWFEGATFSENAGFQGATFSRYARFHGATFGGGAGFDDATFGGITSFSGATFSADAWFRRATFSGEARFKGATFSRGAWFRRATFSGDAHFSGARFHPGANISFDKPRRGRPFRLRRAGETAYRLAKQAAQERGDYAAAGNYHYAEQCAIEDKWRSESKHKPWSKSFWLWWFRLLFGRLVYGYGERPMRPLVIALAVILIWAGLYWAGGAIVPSDPGLEPAARAVYEPSVGECLYCSIVTFTTLGYGDYQPKEPYRLLAASEALLGAALMAVFVVCLSKKYVR